MPLFVEIFALTAKHCNPTTTSSPALFRFCILKAGAGDVISPEYNIYDMEGHATYSYISLVSVLFCSLTLTTVWTF